MPQYRHEATQCAETFSETYSTYSTYSMSKPKFARAQPMRRFLTRLTLEQRSGRRIVETSRAGWVH